MNQSIHHFRDVHAHAAALQGWNLTYSQISAGVTDSTLMQVSSRRCHAFRERINRRVVQHGEAPRDKVCFAIPISIPGTIRMQGRDADENSIFFLRCGEEFMFHMPKGMDLLSLTFDRELFEKTLANVPSGEDVERLLRQAVVRVPAERIKASRQRMMAMFSEALVNEELTDSHAREAEFEQAMIEEMLQLVTDPACDRSQRSGTSVHSFIVEKCHRLALSDTLNAPNVLELCQRLQVSRRTVQNSFRLVAETTPLHYLRSVRLNGVRRTLKNTRAADLSIGDAASQWGFFHLSHFAAEYQELFRELPSQTERAALVRRCDA